MKMLSLSSFCLAGMMGLAAASPLYSVSIQVDPPQSGSSVRDAAPIFPIHESCNSTEVHQLKRAFQETIEVATVAKNHVLKHANSSTIYTKYFGTAATGEVIGWFEKVIGGNREDLLFRCDDPDGNCHQEGWAGYWRGSNATHETNICPLSFEVRRPIEQLCGKGWTVSTGAKNAYWASDLLHRLYHLPTIGEGAVEHYGEANTYAGALELAKTKPELSVRNSDSLFLFALEVYAYDVSVPGVGCVGA